MLKNLFCFSRLLFILIIAIELTKEDNAKPGTTETLPKNNCSTVELCLSGECVSVSHQLLTYMEAGVDPCEDFYSYACGGWDAKFRDGESVKSVGDVMQEEIDLRIKNFIESNWSSSDERLNEVFKQVQTYYVSCMDSEQRQKVGFAQAREHLQKLNSLVVWDNVTGPVSFTGLFSEILKYGETPFFGLKAGSFDYELEAYPVYVLVPVVVEGYILDYEKRQPIKTGGSYKSKITPFHRKSQNRTEFIENFNADILVQLNKRTESYVDAAFPNVPYDSRLSVKRDMKEFNKMLHKIFANISKNETDVWLKISELQDIFTWVNWKVLLEKTFGKTFDDDFKVLVENPQYLRDLNHLFDTNRTMIAGYSALALYSDNFLTDQYQNTDWQSCLKNTKSELGHSVSVLYHQMISSELLETIENDTNLIFEDLKNVFKTKINENKWMSKSSKSKALNKLRRMKGEFAKLNFDADDDIFKNLTEVDLDQKQFFDNTNKLYTSFMKTQRQAVHLKSVSSIYGAYMNDDKPFEPTSDNYPLENKISITLGTFNAPEYTPHAPRYVTFGNLGFLVAHEMSHAFGPNGVKYDSQGYENKWKTPEEEAEFQNLTRCFSQFYVDAFDLLFNGKRDLHGEYQLDGKSTLDENMADSGIDMAFQAYKSWAAKNPQEPKLPGIKFHPDQIFFLSAAQTFCSVSYLENYAIELASETHSPDRERLNALVMNSKHFSNVFQCSSKSTLNPPNKCSLW